MEPNAWAFDTYTGIQSPAPKHYEFNACAVHVLPAVSTVPEPGALLLMASGLLGILSSGKKR